MYRLYINDKLAWKSTSDTLRIFDAQIDIGLNKAGSCNFTLYPEHPMYDRLEILNTFVTVYQDDNIIFYGRILKIVIDLLMAKQVECEGSLAFLLDSIRRPYDFSLSGITVSELFTHFITQHNAQVSHNKQFHVGTINITEKADLILTDMDLDYANTWESLNDIFLDVFGGYLYVRYSAVDGEVLSYLDYIADFTKTTPQRIEYGKNLLDCSSLYDGEDFCTAVIPVGAEDEDGNKATIESVNDGLDYISDTGLVEKYGLICRTIDYQDISDPASLKELGQDMLAKMVGAEISIDVKVVDLSVIDKSTRPLYIGDYVQMVSQRHDFVVDDFLVDSQKIDLLNPKQNTLKLGRTYESLTEGNVRDGRTSYLHIAYADSKDGSVGFNFNSGSYLGQYTDFFRQRSTDYTRYKWSKVKGDAGQKGDKGDQGASGANGKTAYFHIKYSPVENPTANQMTDIPDVFIGTYVDYSSEDSKIPSVYKWARFQGMQGEKGNQGIAGVNGEDGKTSYLHIAYADNDTGTVGFNFFSGIYIGQYTDFSQESDTDPLKYKWSKMKGDTGEKGDKGENGKDAKLISLESDSYVFLADANGTIVSPDTISLNVIKQNTTSTATWSSVPTGIVNGTGDTKMITKSAIGNNKSVKISVTCDGLTDSTTITVVSNGAEGKPATTIVLSNEAVVIGADKDGKVVTGSFICDVLGYVGTTATRPTAVTASGLPAGMSVTQSDITGGKRLTLSYTAGTLGNADNGTITLSIVCNGLSFTKLISWSKSKTGATGAKGDKGDTGAKGDKGDTGTKGDKGDSGSPAIGFALHPNQDTYNMSSRSLVKVEQKIIITCDRQNTNGAITWAVTPSLTTSSSGNTITITIPAKSTVTSFTVTCTVVGVGTKALTILGVPSGNPKPVYIGVHTSDPADSIDVTSEGKLIVGDYYLRETVDADGKTIRVAYYYTGSSWNMVTETTENATEIIANTMYDALQATGTVPELSAINGYFKNLGAYNLFSQIIDALYYHVQKAIYAGGYDKNGNPIYDEAGKRLPGFFLDGLLGIIKAYGAEFIDCEILGTGSFKGNFTHDFFKTRERGVAGKTITFDAKTHWSCADMELALNSLTPMTIYTASGISDSLSLTHAVKVNNSSARLTYYSQSNVIIQLNSQQAYTYTCIANGNIKINIVGARAMVSASEIAWTPARAYVNNVKQSLNGGIRESYIELNLKKGDVIKVEFDNRVNRVRATDGALSITSVIGEYTGVYLLRTDGNWKQIRSSQYYEDVLSVSSNGSSFNSVDNIKYSRPTNFINSTNELTPFIPYAATGTISLNGSPKTITSIVKMNNGIRVKFSDDESYDFTTGNFYDCYGSYALAAQDGGIDIGTALPLADNSFNLGSASKRFHEGYFVTVYGAVFN